MKKYLSPWAKSKIKKSIGIHPTIKLFRSIEKVVGKLSRDKKQLCDEYAMSALGSKEYAPWLYVYSLVSNDFREGWIPDNYYGAVVIPRIKGPYGDISELAAIQSRLMPEIFPDILYIVNNVFLDSEHRVVTQAEAVKVLRSTNGTVVFKADNSKQGLGVRIFGKDEIENLNLKALPNGVVQRFVDQHPDLARFHPGSTATIRLTTVVDSSGDTSLRAAYLRFGSQKDTHVQSASHVRVPINIESGRLFDLGYSVTWQTMANHPDTGEVFAGVGVPGFAQCAAAARGAHKKISFVGCVGWDFAVDANEKPYLLEWNGAHNDIKFSEATQGPCFADLGWELFWR